MLDSSLAKFRAPGTKIMTTVVEQIPVLAAPSGARLLVVNLRQGPTNRPIFVQTWNEFKKFFGNISIAEERKGECGRRSAYYMLQIAPIYVLNLRAFDDALDLAGIVELSTDASVKNANVKTQAYSGLFNKQQFWQIDPKQLIAENNTDKLLMFGNVGSSNISIFVRKSKFVRTSLTFDKWYKNLGRTAPAFVYPEDKVADWYIDVMLFDNTFNQNASANASYGHLFDANGNVKSTVVNELNQTVDGLSQLANVVESGYIATITGSLIPGFINETGENHDVVSLINANVSQYGLLAKVNDDIFDNAEVWSPGNTVADNAQKQLIPVDLLGHALFSITTNKTLNTTKYLNNANVKALSYEVPLSMQTIEQTTNEIYVSDATMLSAVNQDTTLIKLSGVISPAIYTESNGNSTYAKKSKNQIYVVEKTKVGVGEKFVSADGNLATSLASQFVGYIAQIEGYGTILAPVQPYGLDPQVVSSNNWDDCDGAIDGFTYQDAGSAFPKNPTNSHYVYPVGHPLAGNPLVFRATNKNVVHNPIEAEDAAGLYIYQKSVAGVDIKPNYLALPAGYAPSNTRQYIEKPDIAVERVKADGSKWSALVNDFDAKSQIYLVTFDKPLVFNDTTDDNITVSEDSYTTVGKDADSTINLLNGTSIDVYNPAALGNAHAVFRVRTFEQAATAFAPINLSAYVSRNEQFLDGTSARQKEILDMLIGSSLRNSLTNRELLQFSYIVDGFKSYVEPSIKIQLKTIAKERQLCRAIYNMPAIEDFQSCKNPYFRETVDGVFDPKFIPQGGNLQLPYTNTFSIPNEDGWYAYGFGPNLIISDGGRTISLPPAGVVSNNFARKYQSGNPYDMLAGPGAGTISGSGIVGVEYTFNEKNDGTGDRDALDPFGFNIILKKRQTGLQIYSNRTSLNTIETPLQSIHTSEGLMYVQDQINKLLERYVFKFNTAQNRLTIKTEADKICQRLLDDGAISGFTNQMDTKNNTADVINARIGILDTVLFANNGMEIAIHRTKVDGVQNTVSFELL